MNMNPIFNNRKNEPLVLEDGRTIWHARSCAVVAEVCLYNTADKRWYILLGQRGAGVPDCQHEWGLPCGYLDWDETLCEAVVREVWEECGVHLPSLPINAQFVCSSSSCINQTDNFTDLPWGVSDKVDNPKQNISLHFAIMLAWKGEPLPALSNEHAELNEVEGLAWVEIHQAKQMKLAFSHHIRIAKMLSEQHALFSEIEARCAD